MNTAIILSPEARTNAVGQIRRARRDAYRELHRVDRAKQKGRREQLHEWMDQITRLDAFLSELEV